MILAESPAHSDPERKPDPPTPRFREKVRIRFRKEGPLRFLGHHDLMRLWERMLRRAAAPLRMSEGFHPKPRISSPLALALGLVGREEVLEIELDEPMPLAELRERLFRERIEGLSIASMEIVSPRARARVTAVEYTCPLPDDVDRATLEERARRLLAAESVPIERRLPGKPARTVDLRTYLVDIGLESREASFRLKVDPQGTVRPEEILGQLGLQALPQRGHVLCRSRVVLADELPPADAATHSDADPGGRGDAVADSTLTPS